MLNFISRTQKPRPSYAIYLLAPCAYSMLSLAAQHFTFNAHGSVGTVFQWRNGFSCRDTPSTKVHLMFQFLVCLMTYSFVRSAQNKKEGTSQKVPARSV